MLKNKYIPPTLVVDGVIFQIQNNKLAVLLIKRGYAPFKNQWALPGGYNPAGETTIEALSRVLKGKTGLNIEKCRHIEQLYTFDTVARDPRGHAVSVTYMGLGRSFKLIKSDTTQKPEFFAIDELPQLAYDHQEIISYARQRLMYKITYTNAAFALLSKTFTLTQLQRAYEAILGRTLDKRNFRKKVLAQGLIIETDETLKNGASRPAKLYKFKKTTLQALARSVD